MAKTQVFLPQDECTDSFWSWVPLLSDWASRPDSSHNTSSSSSTPPKLFQFRGQFANSISVSWLNVGFVSYRRQSEIAAILFSQCRTASQVIHDPETYCLKNPEYNQKVFIVFTYLKLYVLLKCQLPWRLEHVSAPTYTHIVLGKCNRMENKPVSRLPLT